MTFKEWLYQKFVDWEKSTGDRQTGVSFAKYLGVTQPALSSWLNGRYIPKGRSVAILAKKLGYDVYEVLGLPIPTVEDLSDEEIQMLDLLNRCPMELRGAVVSTLVQVVALVEAYGIIDQSQILSIVADTLRKRTSGAINIDRLVSRVSGTPRQVYPLGVGFYVDRDDRLRFKQTATQAAAELDAAGLDEESDQGQEFIISFFKNAGFALVKIPPEIDAQPENNKPA